MAANSYSGIIGNVNSARNSAKKSKMLANNATELVSAFIVTMKTKDIYIDDSHHFERFLRSVVEKRLFGSIDLTSREQCIAKISAKCTVLEKPKKIDETSQKSFEIFTESLKTEQISYSISFSELWN